MEPDETIAAIRQDLFYRCCEFAVAEAQFCTFAALLARTGQTFPYAVTVIGQQDKLNRMEQI